jgi:hypothetical protein
MVRLLISLTGGIDKPKKSAIIITTQEKENHGKLLDCFGILR